MKTLALLVLSAAVVSFAGCATLDPSETHPVLSKTFGPNKADDVGEAIAIKSTRRIVIVMVKPTEDKAEWARYCAEPPPDASAELFNQFSASLEADLKSTQGQSAKSKAEVLRTYGELAQQIFRRSQGVQVFRDGLYGLCQFYLNRGITEAEVAAKYSELLRESSLLIQTELKQPSGLQAPPQPNK